jgi:thioredoxin-related protein
MQPNGKVFKAENLPFEKPIVIIYFSPDCDDCVKFMDSLFKRIDAFKGTSLVLITYLSVDELTKFTNKYGINNFKNIYAGTESSANFIRNYYKVEKMPFVALYDKNGNIISSYSKDIPLNNLIASLKKLQHPTY